MNQCQSLKDLFLRSNGLELVICIIIKIDADQLYNLTITKQFYITVIKFNLLEPSKISLNLEAINALYQTFFDINIYPYQQFQIQIQ
ncbi:unnamed protein product [Paramecium sonneborni]|uniref:Uncharacterized protein n=1 Tax=Paramecium sonneborni TaxID=65129 RepID=A0A8S1NBB4_9CILI|nr:unnamed protein product [Paramecium sonneborni]